MLQYLMVKEIEQTGLKYLCKRNQYNYNGVDDHLEYKGSGKLWRRILKAHPEYTIKTTVIGLYTKDDLKIIGRYYSDLWDITNSKEWANLKPEEGDGGITHCGTSPYMNPETGKVVYRNEQPEGYEKYTAQSRVKGKIRIHNPETKETRMVSKDAQIPEGWVVGGLRGVVKYGPDKGTMVYNNGVNKIYLSKGDEIPEGYVRGTGVASTKNRIGIHNPNTGEKKYIKEGDTLPEGFVIGIKPTTGKKVVCPFGIFDTVQQCMIKLGMTRYEIFKKVKEDPTNWSISESTEVIKK